MTLCIPRFSIEGSWSQRLTLATQCLGHNLRLAVAMWIGTRLAGAKFTLLSRSGPTSRTSNREHLLGAEFFRHTNLPGWTVYLLTTDMGRFSRKAPISALFIRKPPLY